MIKECFLRLISDNDESFDPQKLEIYSDEQLHEVKEHIKTNLITNGKSRCPTCNGNGTVLNIECALCKGLGVLG